MSTYYEGNSIKNAFMSLKLDKYHYQPKEKSFTPKASTLDLVELEFEPGLDESKNSPTNDIITTKAPLKIITTKKLSSLQLSLKKYDIPKEKSNEIEIAKREIEAKNQQRAERLEAIKKENHDYRHMLRDRRSGKK